SHRTNDEPRRAGHERVGAGNGAWREGCIDHERRGAVDLVEGRHLLARRTERPGNARPVLPDESRVVLGAEPAIERPVDPCRNAALPREEAVADAGRIAEAFRANDLAVDSHEPIPLSRRLREMAAAPARSPNA